MSELNASPVVVNDLLLKMPELKKQGLIALEPCAYFAALGDRYEQLTGNQVDRVDIQARRKDIEECDYLKYKCAGKYDVIIANFPSESSSRNNPAGFNELVLKALKDVKRGGWVCSLQKLTHLESQRRHSQIYGLYKPERIYVYCHRIEWVNDKGVESKGTGMYVWCVWHKGEDGKFGKETKLDWIV